MSPRPPLSRASRAALTILATALLVAVFADPIASDGCVLGWGDGRVHVLDGVVRPGAPSPPHAIEPLVRASPTRPSGAPLAPASRAHPLGTDDAGRDLFAILVHGARTAIALGVAATALSTVLGAAIGALAGSLGGAWDALVGRVSEAGAVLPSVLVAALLRTGTSAGSIVPVLGAVTLVRFVAVARLVRALVLRALAEDWMIASRALGASPLRLAFRHALPHLAGPLLVASASSLGAAVLLEASLAFLGLGALHRASWGAMLAARGPGSLRSLVPAAVALVLVIGSAHVVAEALRRRADPRGDDEPLI